MLVDVGREHHAGVIVVALHQAQVHHEPVPQPQLAQGLIQPFQVFQSFPGLPILEPLLRLGKGLLPAEQPGQLGHGLGGGQVPQGVQQLRKGGIVFGLDGGPQLLLGGGGQRQLVRQHLEEPGVADLHAEVRRTGREGLYRKGNDLQVRPQPSCPHEFNAHLRGFIAAAGQIGPVSVDGLAVKEPQGLPVALQAGGRHAGNGQGAVRTEHNEPAVVVRALVHLLLGDGRARQVKHVEILQPGGDDLPVAPQAEHPGELFLHLPAGAALLKKQVPGALRCNFAVCLHPSRRPAPPLDGKSGPPPFFTLACYYDNV